MNLFLKKILSDKTLNRMRSIKINWLEKCLIKAAKEQDLFFLRKKLEEYVPDISEQYSQFRVDNNFLKSNVRFMHAFQMLLFKELLPKIKQGNFNKNKLTIVDIGDSSGTHLQYISKFLEDSGINNFETLSVNLDPDAIKKIKAKGLKAKLLKAQDLPKKGIIADIFISYETLEHFMNPIAFLKDISQTPKLKYFIITVPFVRQSRIGLAYVRQKLKKKFYAENTHIFEFSPEDWKLIFKFSGWDIIAERIYFQYPKWSIYRLFKTYWKKNDFEGFYGVILRPDNAWTDYYQDWH
jgi:hypothetical protein